MNRAVERRLLHIGIEASMIGVRGLPGIDATPFVRLPIPQGGANIRLGHLNVQEGRCTSGIMIDEAIFMPEFDGLHRASIVDNDAALNYGTCWASCKARDRLDTVAAHEFTEYHAMEPID